MRRLLAFAAALTIVLAACSSNDNSGGSNAPERKDLTVFAASSLTAAFTKMADDYEAANQDVKLVFNFASSSDLAAQIESEGTADVFASASGTYMDEVQDKVGVQDRANFAGNKLVIITPPDNPAGITGIEDLAKDGVQLVLAAPDVPVGDYAREALKNAGILKEAEQNIQSNEPDDAAVVTKIASGEGDAAIVYTSDVTPTVSPTVKAIDIPEGVNVLATYPIAVVSTSTQAGPAGAFVAYVLGPDGQSLLKTYGFLPPPAT